MKTTSLRVNYFSFELEDNDGFSFPPASRSTKSIDSLNSIVLGSDSFRYVLCDCCLLKSNWIEFHLSLLKVSKRWFVEPGYIKINEIENRKVIKLADHDFDYNGSNHYG